MAIRQEQYAIYVRPYVEVSSKINIFLDKGMAIYMPDPLQKIQGSTCNHKKIEGANTENGIWFLVFESMSLDKIRAKYKELIETIGKDYIKVEKKVPMDALITPIS
ncbi:MAG: hypothetical protein ACLUCH_08640 [Lachnospirales bacterium]